LGVCVENGPCRKDDVHIYLFCLCYRSDDVEENEMDYGNNDDELVNAYHELASVCRVLVNVYHDLVSVFLWNVLRGNAVHYVPDHILVLVVLKNDGVLVNVHDSPL
jgi:hypothetical protein